MAEGPDRGHEIPTRGDVVVLEKAACTRNVRRRIQNENQPGTIHQPLSLKRAAAEAESKFNA